MTRELIKDPNMTGITDPWPEARNLQRYDNPLTVLSDHHSPVAIGCWNSDQMGISRMFLQSHAPTASRPVLDPPLRLFVKAEDAWQPVPVVERTCWPGGWMESGHTGSVAITQWVWFSKHNQISVKWRVESAYAKQVQLALSGGHAHSPLRMTGAVSDQHMSIVMTTPACDDEKRPLLTMPLSIAATSPVRSGTFRLQPSQNNMPITAAEPVQDTVSEPRHHLGYWLELQPQVLSADDPADVVATLSWQFNDVPMPESESQSFEAAVMRWKQLLEVAPRPVQPGAYWCRKALVALADLITSTVKSPGYGNFQAKMGIGACTLDHLSHSYFWDTMMTVPALSAMNEDWAAEVIENFTQYLAWQDCAPFAISAFPPMQGVKRSWGGGQAPIAAWSVAKLLACTGRNQIVERLYPHLKTMVDRWFEYADFNRDGIPEWVNTGAPCDNSPRFDQYGGRAGWNNIYLPPIAGIDLCAYLLMEMRCLEKMAADLGLREDAADWKRRYSTLADKTREMLWDKREKIFYDLDLTTYDATKVKTFFNLLPLWAGLEMPECDIHAAIQNHLLNPDELWGGIPFPSVAYGEPTYDPLGYWRGRSWPHVYFWNTEILAKYGYIDEANEAKRRFLAVIADNIDIPENIVSSLQVNDRHEQGLPHYSWGLGVTLMFLWDWHLKPV